MYISQVSGERLQDHWSSGLKDQGRRPNLCFFSVCSPTSPRSLGRSSPNLVGRWRAAPDISLRGSFLAHLSRRLTGELIVYPGSGVRPSSSVVVRRPSVVRRPQFQRSSPLKPLSQSKPNFMWSILRKGERKFI